MYLLRSLAITAVIAAMSMMAVEAQAAPLSLPGADTLTSLFSGVDTPLSAPRWSCSDPSSSRCHCVDLSRDTARIFVVDVDDEAEHFHAEQLVFISNGAAIMARDVNAWRDGSTTSISIGPGIWTPPEGSETLYFDEAIFYFEAQKLTGAALQGLSWAKGVDFDFSFQSCDDATSLSTDDFDSSPQAAIRASATAAQFVDRQWVIEDFEIPGRLSPSITSPVYTGESLSGFLPPALAIHPEGARLTGAYHLANPGLTIRSHADSSKIAGAGIGRWSTSPLCETPPCRPHSLFLDVYAGADGFETASIAGDFGTGTPRRHFSTSIDGLAAPSGTYDPGPVERLTNQTFLRDWSLHRAGASFGGENHALSVGTAISARGPSFFDLTDRPPHATRLWVDYGTAVDVGKASRADVRIQHAEFDITADDSGRLTRLSVGLQRPLGSLQRAFLRPAVRADMLTEVADASQGPEAGSRGQFDALIEGGLAFRGELLSWDHFLSPRAFAGRRLFAEDALPARVHPARQGRDTLHDGGPFNFAGVAIEQHLQSRQGHRLRIPLATTIVDDGRGDQWMADSQLSVEYSSSADQRPIIIGVDARCIDACTDAGVQSRLQLFWSDTLETTHITGLATALHPASPALDRRILSGQSRWYLPEDPHLFDEESLFHASSLRGQWLHWGTELHLLADLISPSSGGVEVVLERFWPQLGWATALHIAALGEDSRWGAVLGLRNSPSF